MTRIELVVVQGQNPTSTLALGLTTKGGHPCSGGLHCCSSASIHACAATFWTFNRISSHCGVKVPNDTTSPDLCAVYRATPFASTHNFNGRNSRHSDIKEKCHVQVIAASPKSKRGSVLFLWQTLSLTSRLSTGCCKGGPPVVPRLTKIVRLCLEQGACFRILTDEHRILCVLNKPECVRRCSVCKPTCASSAKLAFKKREFTTNTNICIF